MDGWLPGFLISILQSQVRTYHFLQSVYVLGMHAMQSGCGKMPTCYINFITTGGGAVEPLFSMVGMAVNSCSSGDDKCLLELQIEVDICGLSCFLVGLTAHCH